MKISGLVLIGMIISSAVWARNDFIPHGFGMKAKGMGGASIAYQEETHGASWNPAGLAFIKDRFDFANAGIDWFKPTPENNQIKLDDNASKKQHLIMPELGINMTLRDELNFGLLVYGNAGMNTSRNTKPDGIDLSQLFFAPTLTKRFGKHALGISLNMAYQRFFANNPAVTKQEYDYSMGLGGSIGWQGQFNNQMTLGAFYRLRTKMDEFEAYKDLLAENGEIDVPSAIGIGIAYHTTSKTVIAFDVLKVKYAEVKAFTKPLLHQDTSCDSNNRLMTGRTCWNNQTIYKLGISYKYNNRLSLRTGLNYNQLTPEKQVTLGGTWHFNKRSEMSVFYMPVFDNLLGRDNSGGGEQSMYHNSFGVSYGWHF
ncbi:MAG: outer membrane protein transport protein [Pseudomonadota bacterium]